MRLRDAALRTLELCRHEHYEDSPWREQSLYAYDSRLQALYGYYAFGDYRFPHVSFDILAHTLDEDGFLSLVAPGAVLLIFLSLPLHGWLRWRKIGFIAARGLCSMRWSLSLRL